MRVDEEKQAGRRKRICSEHTLMRSKEGSKEEVTYGFGDEAIGLVTHTEHRFIGIHFVGVWWRTKESDLRWYPSNI